MRIQKYLSQSGILSRREAERKISAGKVTVNGIVVTNLATQIDPEKDIVSVTSVDKTTSLLLYKPRGIVCTKGTTEGKNIFDLDKRFVGLNTVGRLDKESEGIIILTNDGVLARAVTDHKNRIEKEYEVQVEERITGTKINALSKQMYLTDGLTKMSYAQKMSEHIFRIVLTEGRNHQVRRMADKVGLSVLRLKRIRIGTITGRSLQEGDWRPLTEQEINTLKK